MTKFGRVVRLAETGFVLGAVMVGGAAAQAQAFGPSNPFYAKSTLPFEAPPFDRIKDADYQPAIEAGIGEQKREIEAIANNPAAPTFDNTIVAMEKTGQLLSRVSQVFDGIAQANTNPALQKVQEIVTPERTALQDAITLNTKLFKRIETLYNERASLNLDAEQLRLLEVDYQQFVKAGATLSEGDKARLKALNSEESTLSNKFTTLLLAATKAAAYKTTDKAALAGLSEAQVSAAAEAAKGRSEQGYVLPLQNTTQQPLLTFMSDRAARKALFDDSWTRTERGGENDTRATIARIAQVRAEKAKLLGYPNYATWALQDQMAKTPAAATQFMNDLVGPSIAKARSEEADIQQVIDAQKGGFKAKPWDWEFYSEQVRKAKYDLDESAVKP